MMFLSKEDFSNSLLVFKLIVTLRCESKYDIAETFYEGLIPEHIAELRSYIALLLIANGIRLLFGHLAIPHTPPVADVVRYLWYNNIYLDRFIEIYLSIFGHKPI